MSKNERGLSIGAGLLRRTSEWQPRLGAETAPWRSSAVVQRTMPLVRSIALTKLSGTGRVSGA